MGFSCGNPQTVSVVIGLVSFMEKNGNLSQLIVGVVVSRFCMVPNCSQGVARGCALEVVVRSCSLFMKR